MNIYVGNLSWSMTNEDLHSIFAPFGEIASAKIVTDKFKPGRSKGFGFVEMPDDAEALKAINALNDTDSMGRKLIVNESKPKPEGERSSYRGNSGGGYKKSYGSGGGSSREGGYRGSRDSNGSGNGGYKERNNDYNSRY